MLETIPVSLPASTQFFAMDILFRTNHFFDEYAKALESFNAKSLAHCYELPCSFLSDEKVTSFTDAVQLEGFFSKGLTFYKLNGIAVAGPEVWNKERLATGIIKVKLNWHYYNETGEPLYNCTYYYLLRNNAENELKIVTAISVNEKERMEEWLKVKTPS